MSLSRLWWGQSCVESVDWRLQRKQLLSDWLFSCCQWSGYQETSNTKERERERCRLHNVVIRGEFGRQLNQATIKAVFSNPLSLYQMEEQRVPTLIPQNFTDIKFWEKNLSVTSSAALWIIKRHVVVDLDHSCRVDLCDCAADWEKLRSSWLDGNQTSRRKNTGRTTQDPELEGGQRQETKCQQID